VVAPGCSNTIASTRRTQSRSHKGFYFNGLVTELRKSMRGQEIQKNNQEYFKPNKKAS
jgi:hypothetical protein